MVKIIQAAMRNLKVYITDDHALYRGAITKLVRDFVRVKEVKEAQNGKVLFSLIREDIPDVVLLDLEMPEWDGTTTCKKLAREFPEVRIIIVSVHDSKAHINFLLNMGAHAFVSKNIEPEELEEAIYSVVDKGLYRNRTMEEALDKNVQTNRVLIPKKIELSIQEQSVLQLLCKGSSIKEISYELTLSEYTIRSCKVRLMQRLGVKKLGQLISFAIQNDLIDKF